MKLPAMNDKGIMRPAVLTKFGGINHNLSAGDGEFYDMLNLSSRDFPLLIPRKSRGYVQEILFPQGIGAYDKPWWVSGRTFYYDGVEKGTVTATRKQFAVMGGTIVIFPDKKCYDADTDTLKDMEASYTSSAGGVTFADGTYAGVPAKANTLFCSDVNWASYFKAGDAVTISGCVGTGNDGTFIIREISGHELRFYENTFDPDMWYCTAVFGDTAGVYAITANGETYKFNMSAANVGKSWRLYYSVGDDAIKAVRPSGSSYEILILGIITTEDAPVYTFTLDRSVVEAGSVTVARNIPDLDFICVNENRLWGCKGDVIYASALGDPFNFNVFDGLATDSWQSSTVDSGDFTGCISYGGYPMFFKPETIYKVQGDKPSNFQWTAISALGVKPGCERSLVVTGGTLFYLSRAGICAYSGWKPTVISDALGADTKWSDAAAGSDSIRYYVSMTDGKKYTLYVFDTRYGIWFKEDDTQAVGFAFWNDGLYYANSSGQLVRVDGTEGTSEGPVPWEAEFGDSVRFYETTDTGSQNKKGVLRFQLRCELAEGSVLKALVRYEDSDEWEEVGTILGPAKKQSYNLPLILRRCDYYRLKLIGIGEAVVYSLTEVRYSGSNLQGGKVTLPTE